MRSEEKTRAAQDDASHPSHVTPHISIIVAMAENRVIGRDNALPWRLPNDLKHFKRITTGHPIIMGRKSYESIGKPLPNRTNIVVTRSPGYSAPGCVVTHTIDTALAAAGSAPEMFVIGGAELYAQTLARACRLYLTWVHADIDGTARFPEINWNQWRELSRERHTADTQHAYDYTFVMLERRA